MVLLRRMADYRPELVEDALRSLGVDRTAMREANRRWQAMVRSRGGPHGVRRYRAVLGEPESVVRRRVGDLSCEALRWGVPLWPTLRFEAVAVAGGGGVWHEGLVRAAGAAGPLLRGVGDLRAWCCTVDEVAAAFPSARPLEGSAPTRWRLAVDGQWVAHFTWGLLQEVEVLSGGG